MNILTKSSFYVCFFKMYNYSLESETILANDIILAYTP